MADTCQPRTTNAHLPSSVFVKIITYLKGRERTKREKAGEKGGKAVRGNQGGVRWRTSVCWLILSISVTEVGPGPSQQAGVTLPPLCGFAHLYSTISNEEFSEYSLPADICPISSFLCLYT